MRIIQLSLVLLLTAATTAWADNDLDYSQYLHWQAGAPLSRSGITDTAVHGSYLYCAGGDGIAIIRIDEESIQPVGTIDHKGSCSRLTVVGDQLIADSYLDWGESAVLHIHDLTNPEAPELVETILLPAGGVLGLQAKGDHLFVGIFQVGVLAYDLRETASRRLVGSLDMPFSSNIPFHICGDLLLTGSSHNKSLIDISDPRNMGVVSTIAASFAGVDHEGTYLYFTSYDQTLAIWDISEPAVPHRVAIEDVLRSSGRDIQVRDGVAYVASNYNGGGILTFDVSNPLNPTYLGETRVRQGGEYVDLVGERALLTGRPTAYAWRVDMFDVTNPRAAAEASHWNSNGNLGVISVHDQFAYARGVGGDRIFVIRLNSVHNASVVAEISSFASPRALASGPGWVAVAGLTPEVQIFNTQYPANPTLLSTVPLPDGTVEMAHTDGLLAVACSHSGIVLIDIADPGHPAIVAQLPELGVCRSVCFEGRVLVTTRNDEILAIDCSVPQEPEVRIIGVVPDPHGELAVHDGRVYCASFSRPSFHGNLRVFELAPSGRTAMPVLEYSIPVAGEMITVGDFLYMASYGSLWVFDIRDGCRIIGNGPLVGGHQLLYNLAEYGPYVLGTTSYAGIYAFAQQETPAMETVAEPWPAGTENWEESGGLEVFPNPFNPRTTVAFKVRDSRQVRLAVFDIRGQLVKELVDRSYSPGEYEATWQGRDSTGRPVPSGEYFIRLEQGNEVSLSKALLVR